jgi:hypothetical protein
MILPSWKAMRRTASPQWTVRVPALRFAERFWATSVTGMAAMSPWNFIVEV